MRGLELVGALLVGVGWRACGHRGPSVDETPISCASTQKSVGVVIRGPLMFWPHQGCVVWRRGGYLAILSKDKCSVNWIPNRDRLSRAFPTAARSRRT
jgi:hypothetical protein